MLKFNHEVRIHPTHNGIIVQVGCKTLCFEQANVGIFLSDLGIYLDGGEQAMIGKYLPEMVAEPKETRTMGGLSRFMQPVDAPDPCCVQQAPTNDYL